jgi:putative SbcD/Mre11-related phosphoesterase
MAKNSSINKKYIFIGKTLFFPKEKIVVIGDLHLGYEQALRQKGLNVPIRQFEEAKEELTKTLDFIKNKYGKIEEIVFLGDIKHHFNYSENERQEIKLLLTFLKKYVSENKIIFIRGNHEKNEKSGKYIDYYLVKDIAFVHGHREYPQMYDKTVNLVVMGHLHPTVTLADKMGIKKEKYKCFLGGRYKKKDFLVVPSFISITEGVSLTELDDSKGYDFCIIPQAELQDFEVYVCSETGKGALGFGKLKELD